MAFTNPQGEFRAGTLGDLFVPIMRMYSRLFATFVPPYRPNFGLSGQLYEKMSACRNGKDFKRFVYSYKKWGGPEGKIPFDIRMYKQMVDESKLPGNRVGLPLNYIDDIIPEFQLGKIHPDKHPYFAHSSLLKKTRSVPPARLVAGAQFVKQYLSATSELSDIGMGKDLPKKIQKLVAVIEGMEPDFPLSKLAGKVPKLIFEFRPQFAIEMACFFDTGVTLKSSLTQNDIIFQLAVTHGWIVAPEIQIRQGYDLKIFSGGITLELPGGIINLANEMGRHLEKTALEEFFLNTKAVAKIRKMLKQFPENEFGVIFSYYPSRDPHISGGIWLYATQFNPVVSKFSMRKFDRNIRNFGLRLLAFRLRDKIGAFLVENLEEIVRELDPDKIQEVVSRASPRKGAGGKYFGNGGK